ncbi:hypothetical protein PUN28_005371 [Cardiocondyla obscurior]|uniref:Uncharacterized protein n=1 Tax=Cardiocondyla obscurior TaxID=286306 RepID=A0AAW2GHC7_9HYME
MIQRPNSEQCRKYCRNISDATESRNGFDSRHRSLFDTRGNPDVDTATPVQRAPPTRRRRRTCASQTAREMTCSPNIVKRPPRNQLASAAISRRTPVRVSNYILTR